MYLDVPSSVFVTVIHFYFSAGAIARSSAAYGRGIGQIWLDDMNCLGNESDIAFCGHRGWGNTNCAHYEDVGVVCNCKFDFFQR